MSLTIQLSPDMEERLREEAIQEGVTPEQFAAQRLMEAELLWRIRTAAPEPETRQLNRLLRRRNLGTLSDAEWDLLQTILDAREMRGAQRLQDLTLLSRLRAMPVRQLMRQLGIHPLATP